VNLPETSSPQNVPPAPAALEQPVTLEQEAVLSQLERASAQK
jgi:hypothetical protein